MEIDVVEGAPEGVQADVLVFPVPDPVALPRAAEELDRRVEGTLRHLIEDGELKGERGCVTVFHTNGKIAAHRLAAAGVGEAAELDSDSYRTAAARVATRTAEMGGHTVAWILEDNGEDRKSVV